MSAAGAPGVERLGVEERLGKVLEGHQWRLGGYCTCGFDTQPAGIGRAEARREAREQYAAHVAAALAAEVAAMQAEAVREALEGAAEAPLGREVEFGLQFVPPHKNAGEAAWMPDLRIAAYVKDDLSELVWREVGPWVRLADAKPPLAAQTSRDPREGSQGVLGAAGGRVGVAEGGEGTRD